MTAIQQDGTYPRPMLRRDGWASLDGTWDFAHDDERVGLTERWFDSSAVATEADPFTRTIEVPYPPESPASTIGDRGFHPVVWYRRAVARQLLVPTESDGQRVLLHFGAVDYRASVWVDGQLVATHVGGQTPFQVDVTDALALGAAGTADATHTIVVRAEDDPNDFEQPRGKQDWRAETHGIWYERTTGIWQSVWAETVAANHIVDIVWIPDVAAGLVRAEVSLAHVPRSPLQLQLNLHLGDELLAHQTVRVTNRSTVVVLALDVLRNGQERARLLWSPESPTLIDASLTVRHAGQSAAATSDGSADDMSADPLDTVASYFGLRSVSVGGATFNLNDQPYYVRSVLNQGYRPSTHLAAADTNLLRTEVETIKAMGFNSVRNHQKAEDPRFLYWADRLGLMVWAETAAAYEFSTEAVALLTAEWTDLVRRDRSHPSVVAWIPVNESWGVQDIANNAAQRQYVLALASLTRALDPGRPVVTNEGWEHVDSDILGLHDYTTDPDVLRARYATKQASTDMVLSAHGPQGRRPVLTELQAERFLSGDAPLMITEFGGISLSNSDTKSWGYGHVNTAAEYGTLLLGLFDALRASPEISGFCYTQYMDTGQETNGLLFMDGTPKLALRDIHRIVTGLTDGGTGVAGSTFGWAD
jgi:beta-galactosidase/beta-glucuronidase